MTETELRTCVVDGWRTHDRESQVCLPCESRMDRQLELLGKVAHLLTVVARTEPTASGELDLHVLDLTLPGNPVIVGAVGDQVGNPPIAAKLGEWAQDWSRREIWSVDVEGIVAFLRRGLKWAGREHPAIDEFAKELRGLYASARRALRRDRSATHYAAPCPSCGQKTLLRYPGADWIECGPCEWLWSEEEYPVLALRALRQAMPPNQMLTTHEASVIAAVSPDVIRQWASRGRLAQVPGPTWGEVYYYRIEVDWTLAKAEERMRRLAAHRAELKREMMPV